MLIKNSPNVSITGEEEIWDERRQRRESERERAQRTGEAGDRPDCRDAAVTLIN